MAKVRGKAFISTSGWNYKHWIGTFYPAQMTNTWKQLDFFVQHFSTVELNNSFYKMPSRTAFEAWKTMTPPDFIFAVKAGRFLTHMKKLKDAKLPVERFFERAYGLGEKLGPVLFQLPPTWNVNIERFADFLKVLPEHQRYVFEFRNGSWYNEEIYSLLRNHNCAFCIYELDGHMSPMLVTADFVYIRLHGPGGKYQGSYDDAALTKWSARIKKWLTEGKDVYLYFDNDQEAYAVFNARKLNQLVKGSRQKEKRLF